MRHVSGRLTALLVGLFAALLIPPGVALEVWLRDVEEKTATSDARLKLRLLRERRGAPPAELDALLAALGAEAEIVGSDGRRVHVTSGFRTDDPERLVVSEDVDGLRVSLAVSRKPHERAGRQLRLTLGLLAAPVLLIGGGLALWLIRGMLAPLEEIRRRAERISRESSAEPMPEELLRGDFGRLARSFEEMRGRIDRALEDLKSFAADAAHELRAPLANLRAELEAAAQREPNADDERRTLGSVAEEVARMSRVVADLLTLARLDLKRQALAREEVRIGPLLEETRELCAPLGVERSVRVVSGGDGGRVLGDPAALRRVFFNLAHNAVKYNRPGGEVELRDVVDGDTVRILVRDSGPGIAPEHLPKLFRRFYRVDPARSRDSGGAGLGLAICKSFVEAHGGRIHVSSEPGKGSTFVVELPRLS